MLLEVAKCPSDWVALSNCLAVRDDKLHGSYASYQLTDGRQAYYKLVHHKDVGLNEVGMSAMQRKFANVAFGQKLNLEVVDNVDVAGQITLEVEPVKKTTAAMTFDTDEMLHNFCIALATTVVFVGEPILLVCAGVNLQVTVKAIKQFDLAALRVFEQDTHVGIVTRQTTVVFDVAPHCVINLVGSARGKSAVRTVFNPDWDFTKMGIGGLDEQFQTMFRRAFASRVLPPDVVRRMGMKHVRGILLHGPPGTGKTLMARQIGKMLQGREPKVVNGPEVLSKFVGESEANVRRLFEDAEKEQRERGENSGLHIIIFDEIDSICKSRGSITSGTGVHDSLVNQLLSKIDGVESLNNVLLIGMTNRIDMLDEALLRPGRLELKIQIDLPSQEGRLQILRIHTRHLSENSMLDSSVDLEQLSVQARNFSGAEIEGLVRCANSYATNRCVDSTTMKADEEKLATLRVTMDDFQLALTEIQPAFGVPGKEIDKCMSNGIVNWGGPFENVLETGKLMIELMKSSSRIRVASLMIAGAHQTGKTAFAAHLAALSGAPLVKLVSAENMVGFNESAKLAAIHRAFEDAYKSDNSVVIIDDIERLIEYCPLGERFSNALLQALMVLIGKVPKNDTGRILILATASDWLLMDRLGLAVLFSRGIIMPTLTAAQEVEKVLLRVSGFTHMDIAHISGSLNHQVFSVGIKKLYLLIEMAKQKAAEDRYPEFLSLMVETLQKPDKLNLM